MEPMETAVAPAPPNPPEPPDDRPRRVPLWGKFTIGFAVFLVAVIIAGFVIHVPYSTISPGEAVPLANLVHVDGAETFPTPRGDIRLLFVRERQHVSLWRYLQARLDPNVDIFKEQQLNPNNLTPTQLNNEAIEDMDNSKTAATKVALEAAGYTVKTAPGVDIISIETNLPSAKVLQLGDSIMAADGHKILQPGDLTRVVHTHKAGQQITLNILREGKPLTVHPTLSEVQNTPIIGITVSPRYSFPVKVNVDTANIGGPSAGLAMTLAILDYLTPGNLVGPKRVSVTGTIDPAGNVGEIGGIAQKAVAARVAGSSLFIVPKCDKKDDPPDAYTACENDLQRAIQRAGSRVKVVPVSTFDEALAVLRANGGDAVTPIAPSARAA
jgi:PDZ domain-containing protein